MSYIPFVGDAIYDALKQFIQVDLDGDYKLLNLQQVRLVNSSNLHGQDYEIAVQDKTLIVKYNFKEVWTLQCVLMM